MFTVETDILPLFYMYYTFCECYIFDRGEMTQLRGKASSSPDDCEVNLFCVLVYKIK